MIVDVPDGDNMKFPRGVVLDAIGDYAEQGLVTEEYGKSVESIRGRPVKLELSSTGELVLHAVLDARGKRLRELGCEYAMGGVLEESHMEGDVRVVDKFRLREVTLTSKRIPLRREEQK